MVCPEAEEYMAELDENTYEAQIKKPRGGKKPFRETTEQGEEIVIEDVAKTRDGQFRTDPNKASSTGNTDKSNFVTDYQEYKSQRRNI